MSRNFGIPFLLLPNSEARGPGTSGLWTAASWLGLDLGPAVTGHLTLDTLSHVAEFQFPLL